MEQTVSLDRFTAVQSLAAKLEGRLKVGGGVGVVVVVWVGVVLWVVVLL
jgi:hypothetical protein